MKQAQKAGLKPEEIAERLGLTIQDWWNSHLLQEKSEWEPPLWTVLTRFYLYNFQLWPKKLSELLFWKSDVLYTPGNRQLTVIKFTSLSQLTLDRRFLHKPNEENRCPKSSTHVTDPCSTSYYDIMFAMIARAFHSFEILLIFLLPVNTGFQSDYHNF